MNLTASQIECLRKIYGGQQVFSVDDKDVEFLHSIGFIRSVYLPREPTEREWALDLEVKSTHTECILLPKGQSYLDDLIKLQKEKQITTDIEAIRNQVSLQTDIAEKQVATQNKGRGWKSFLAWAGLIVSVLGLLATIIIPLCR